MISDISNN